MTAEPPLLIAARTLAFLFTDIEGSTRLWERHPEAMRTALAQHDRILTGAVAAARGQVVKTTGDGIMAVFDTARDGVAATLAAQQGLLDGGWPETGPLRVRMGLHVGEGRGDGSDYHGPAVNRAARIMAAGHGGQILLSGPTAALVMDQLPDGTSLRDLGEHLLKDLARPERLYQLDYPSMPATFRPLTTADVRVGSLPAEPSAFVGRERELAGLLERLRDPGIRLLTLTGPGGIGKTRLALRAAHDAQAGYRAGAAFVDLSAARDSDAMLTTLGRELGVRDARDTDQFGELVARLAPLQLLLVLDNVEQVALAGATLLRVLQGCPDVTILLTSREPLHVRGERVVVVPPLGLPPADVDRASADQLEQFEAVLLFVERARAVRPDFRVTDDNAALVADICRRLEGLPLAIELAVARLRVFSLEVLRERLGSRLHALGSGPRELPERQQTLRATIDWSYQLLPPSEQRLFTLLCCFMGADIEAIEAVVAELLAGGPRAIDPADGVLSLIDKSLLRQVVDEAGAPRFEMLESVREFALEQLESDPEAARRTRAAHARYYAGWALERADRSRGPDRAQALRELADDVENLRAAWRVSMGERDLDQLDALRAGLRSLYDARGWYRALADLAGQTLSIVESLESSPGRDASIVALYGDRARALAAIEGFTEEVDAAYGRLLTALETTAAPRSYPVLRGLASYYSFRNEPPRVIEFGRQLLDLGVREGDPEIQAEGHLFVGTGGAFLSPIADGIEELEHGLAVWPAQPQQLTHPRPGPHPRVSTLTALSLLTWWRGRLETSLGHSHRALELAKQLDHPSTTGYALHHAALLRLWREEPAEAREIAIRVIEVADEHEMPVWSAVGTAVLGCAAVALGSADEGLRWVAEGLDRYRGLRTPPVFWPFLLHLRAGACRVAGDLDAGLAAAREAVTLAPNLPDLHLVLGDLLLDSGDRGAATTAWEAASAVAHGWGAVTVELKAAIRLAGPVGAPVEGRADRLAALRAVVEGLTEGLDAPDITQARALLVAG